MRLKDKTALITGGARGIGKEIAVRFAKEGADIIIWDVLEEGEKVAEEIKKIGRESVFQKVDITNLTDIREKAKDVIQKFDGLDILVNNAGITRDNLIIRMEESEWESVITVNLKGTFNCTKSFIKYMMKARKGRIINISSVIGLFGNAGQSNYAASKAGIIGFTKSIAKEVGSRNITVNAIAPGFIQTPMTDVLSEEVKKTYLSIIPLKKFGLPEDIANVALFLASDAAKYITGEVIRVDGGLAM